MHHKVANEMILRKFDANLVERDDAKKRRKKGQEVRALPSSAPLV
jgi:hypothetical protein